MFTTLKTATTAAIALIALGFAPNAGAEENTALAGLATKAGSEALMLKIENDITAAIPAALAGDPAVSLAAVPATGNSAAVAAISPVFFETADLWTFTVPASLFSGSLVEAPVLYSLK